MTRIKFWKMEGAGNDFVVVDNSKNQQHYTPELISQLCDRKRGIGADGFLALEFDNAGNKVMVYHNSDGTSANMCGNGARCFAHFTDDICNNSKGDDLSFLTNAGRINAVFIDENHELSLKSGMRDLGKSVEDYRLVRISMTEVSDIQLGINSEFNDVEFAGKEFAEFYFLNTGVEHVVVKLNDEKGLKSLPIKKIGAAIRFHQYLAPKGANVNFVFYDKNLQKILVRTYERGVENETLACGTGLLASAIIIGATENISPPIRLISTGGDELQVDFKLTKNSAGNLQVKNPQLLGPSRKVFGGEMTI